MLGSDGKPEGIIVFGFEVTEQVLARRRLEQLGGEREHLIAELRQAVRAREQSEERYRLAVEATGNAFLDVLSALRRSATSVAWASGFTSFGRW